MPTSGTFRIKPTSEDIFGNLGLVTGVTANECVLTADDGKVLRGVPPFDFDGVDANPDTSSIVLDEGTVDETTVSFAGLPAGFTVTSVVVHARISDAIGGTGIAHTLRYNGSAVLEVEPGLGTLENFAATIVPTPSTIGTFFGTSFGVARDRAGGAGGGGNFDVDRIWVDGTYEIITATNYINCEDQEVAPGVIASVCQVSTDPIGPEIDLTEHPLTWWHLGFKWLYQPFSPGPDWVNSGSPEVRGWWQSFEEFRGGAMVIDEDSEAPKAPRTYQEIGGFDADSILFGAGCAAVVNNHIIYARGGNIWPTDQPKIGIFDGISDRTLVNIPATERGDESYGVMSLQQSNGTIYVCVYDPGEDSGNDNNAGRVFQLDASAAKLSQLGTEFTLEEVPYAVTWWNGRLWCVTHIGDPTFALTEKGKLYSMLPDFDTTWTEVYDLSVTTGTLGGTFLVSFDGKLYIGTTAEAATFGKILTRDSAGTIATSITGSGGTAKDNNGFLAACVFRNELYATFFNNDSTPVATIHKFDGTNWSTVYTGSAGDGTNVQFIGIFVAHDNIYAVGAPTDAPVVLLGSLDGDSWLDLSAFLPGEELGTSVFAALRF